MSRKLTQYGKVGEETATKSRLDCMAFICMLGQGISLGEPDAGAMRERLGIAIASKWIRRNRLPMILIGVGRGKLVGPLPEIGVFLKLLDVPPDDDHDI